MKFGVLLNQRFTPDGEFAVTDPYEQAELMERFGEGVPPSFQ